MPAQPILHLRRVLSLLPWTHLSSFAYPIIWKAVTCFSISDRSRDWGRVIFIPVEDGPDSELDSGGWETDWWQAQLDCFVFPVEMMLPDQERHPIYQWSCWGQGAVWWWSSRFTCAGELVMSVLPPDVDVTVVAGHHFWMRLGAI